MLLVFLGQRRVCRTANRPWCIAGPDQSIVRAYAVTPAGAAAPRAAGSVDVTQLAPAAKPAQGGQLSGTHLSFAVSGLVLAPEAVADAVQVRLLLSTSTEVSACQSTYQRVLPQVALEMASMPAPQVSLTLSLRGLGGGLPSASTAKASWHVQKLWRGMVCMSWFSALWKRRTARQTCQPRCRLESTTASVCQRTCRLQSASRRGLQPTSWFPDQQCQSFRPLRRGWPTVQPCTARQAPLLCMACLATCMRANLAPRRVSMQ